MDGAVGVVDGTDVDGADVDGADVGVVDVGVGVVGDDEVHKIRNKLK